MKIEMCGYKCPNVEDQTDKLSKQLQFLRNEEVFQGARGRCWQLINFQDYIVLTPFYLPTATATYEGFLRD